MDRTRKLVLIRKGSKQLWAFVSEVATHAVWAQVVNY